MLGSFQIFDGDQVRRSPDGASVYWRGLFHRSEAQIVPGSWDVAGLRATGSFDWTVEDVFLPERRTMVHAGVPLDNQWSHWGGVSFALPAGVGADRSDRERRSERLAPATPPLSRRPPMGSRKKSRMAAGADRERRGCACHSLKQRRGQPKHAGIRDSRLADRFTFTVKLSH